MTTFLDIHIPFDPENPDALNPALVCLSWVAWPHVTSIDQAHRDRLTATMAAAIYKQAGKQMPANLPRVRRENIHATAQMALRRICQYRLPAVLLVLSRWAERGLLDLSRAGLTTDQEQRLAKALAVAAGRLRTGNDQIVPPRNLHDIGEATWLDARPALAMTMALPVSWTGVAFEKRGSDVHDRVSRLFTDHSWVQNAMRNAQALAQRLIQTLNPPPSPLLVPKRKNIRSDTKLIPLRKQALVRLLNTPKDRTS
jgi:hypothetical protein